MNRARLIAEMSAGATPEFLYFWGHTRTPGHEVGRWVLSQWWPVEFPVGGVSYRSAEHFMMAEKARLFGDEEMRARVLASATPADAKRLGRAVRGFGDATWLAHRYDIVVRGSIAKFGAHETLRGFLVGTGDKVLVEAAPRDTIWGIGLGADRPEAADPASWRGENLLGFALMEARAALR
ncbi:NADAR family protein [Nocardia otitidiscaviarum]|uniref:NADAR family protein n=1 Tax=Nocardia otitidiscaviarum TaxID=1823 RepID=A0A516NIH5_9NOCA|nr:NADAR family protein [Nocardia otitidiscaviarum]MCP9619884.1 NADAR family protein [Nocardia otitidiscaviarum]QDP78714.1 NADAR family protein [Nocardia otitidiscaviarum]